MLCGEGNYAMVPVQCYFYGVSVGNRYCLGGMVSNYKGTPCDVFSGKTGERKNHGKSILHVIGCDVLFRFIY